MIRSLPRRFPVTTGVVAVLLLSAVLTGALLGVPSARQQALLGIDPALVRQGHLFPGLITGVLLPSGPLESVLLIIAGALFVGQAERLMGWWRALVAFVVTALTGTLAGIGLQQLGVLARGVTGGPPATAIVSDPFTPIVGVVLAASAFAGPLWRRRIRVLGLAALAVVLLYSGRPGDLYRMCAGLIGLALGEVLARRRTALPFRRSSHHEVRSLLAALAAVTAVGPLIALLPRGYGLLRPLGQLVHNDTPGGRGADQLCRTLHSAAECAREFAAARQEGIWDLPLAVLPLLALLLGAYGLWHGRRVAAIAVIGVEVLYALLAGVYFDLLPQVGLTLLGLSVSVSLVQAVLSVAVPLAVAAIVAAKLRHFDVGSGVVGRRASVIAGAAVLGIAVTSVVAGMLVRTQFAPTPQLGDLVGDLGERFVPPGFLRFRRADFVPVGPAAHLVWTWTGPAAWLVVIALLVTCLTRATSSGPQPDLPRLERLLRVGSRGPIAAMGLWSGSRHWFSTDGRHAVAYRVVGTVAVTIGEPIGPAAGAAAVAADFAVFCDDRGLTPVFYTVSPRFARSIGQGRRWHTLPVGEDAWLAPAHVEMRGKRWADVRSSINRADRTGVRAVWTDWHDCCPAYRRDIEAISREWVADRALPEMGFTLGGVAELKDEHTRLLLAVDADDRVVAVTSWLPTYRDGETVGLTLDFMRRRPGGMNGVMEFLIARAVLDAQRDGYEFLSLSVSPLARSSRASELPSLADRALTALSHVLEPAYGFRSLADFKEKFQPEMRPLVMAYPDAVSLPAIGLALVHAYLPDLSPRHLPVLLRAVRSARRTRVRSSGSRGRAAVPVGPLTRDGGR